MPLGDADLVERGLVHIEGVMAGRDMAVPVVRRGRLDLLADLRHVPAAGMEPAPGGRIDRAGDIALEDDPLALVAQIRIWDRYRREQGLRVRHDRPLVELV